MLIYTQALFHLNQTSEKMPSTQKYSRSEVEELIGELIRVIKTRNSFPSAINIPKDFVRRNPWTNKYVSRGFSEADQLMELAKAPDFDITFVPMGEVEREWRHDRKMKMKLHFRTSGGDRHERTFSFYFEEQEEGVYIPLNG